jgi:FAD/FMN-containing dehydrogenase
VAATPRTLLSAGGLYETTAPVYRPRTTKELASLLADALRHGKRLTLIGAGRSFGRHFFPPEGVRGVDTTALCGTVTPLEATGDGLWVRVPGSHSFEQLWRDVPGYLPQHPPTSDRVTIAGALASCGHNTSGFFAEGVRAFRVMIPDGSTLDCRPDGAGRSATLFDCVPGSFGALGVILDVELFLRRLVVDERVEISVIDRLPSISHRALDCLDAHVERGDYPLGLGIFYYGKNGPTAVLGDRAIAGAAGRRAPTLPLVDEATTRNVVLQGLANWAPSASLRLQPLALRKGRRFHATPYGFAYYQRSYERAQGMLESPAYWARALRAIGVDPRLPVCHQTFVVPLAAAREFLTFYFAALRRAPKAASRLEMQDLIRLGPCRWPLHAGRGMPGGFNLLSVSLSVRRGEDSLAAVRGFLGAVTAEAFERFGVRVLLLKQTHCDPALLREMHTPFVACLRAVRDEVDPARVLTSQLLEALGV